MKPRTLQQNKSLHKYFSMLAQALNEAGYDIQHTLRHDVSLPWTSGACKELLWRPIQRAMTDGKESTTELDRMEPGQIYDVLNLHLGEKLGIHVPFPCESSQYDGEDTRP